MKRQTMTLPVSRTTPTKRTAKGSTVTGTLPAHHDTHGSRSLDSGLRGGFLSTLDEMERFFDETLHRPFLGFSLTPLQQLLQGIGEITESRFNVDLFEEGGNLVLRADLPGMTRENIDVSVVDNCLVISGERRMEDKVDQQNYLRVERSYGSFSRSVLLPEGLDTNQISAHLQDGVLEIRLPRVEGGREVKHIAIE